MKKTTRAQERTLAEFRKAGNKQRDPLSFIDASASRQQKRLYLRTSLKQLNRKTNGVLNTRRNRLAQMAAIKQAEPFDSHLKKVAPGVLLHPTKGYFSEFGKPLKLTHKARKELSRHVAGN